jgi:hypothetical protein
MMIIKQGGRDNIIPTAFYDGQKKPTIQTKCFPVPGQIIIKAEAYWIEN